MSRARRIGGTAIASARRSAAVALLAAVTVVGLAPVALAAEVSMVDDEFAPASITIAAGEVVTFTNNGDRPHTATADDGAFDTDSVDPGASATVTFDTPGEYPYFCQFHGDAGGSGMAGVITVTAAGGDGGGDQGGAGNGAGDPAAGPPLPRTATPLPLIGALGGAVLLAGLLAGRRRRA